MIEYQIIVRSIKVTDDGADTADYVLARRTVPEESEFDEAMLQMAAGFRILADLIDQKVEGA